MKYIIPHPIETEIFYYFMSSLKMELTLVTCKVTIFMILYKIRSIEIFPISPIKLFTVTCPLRDVLMHTNTRTDVKEFGFYSHHANSHKNACSNGGNFTRQESFGV